MIKLVIFDLDGVLVNACEWHRVALNEALRDVCNYEISLEDHYSTFNGIPTKKKLDILKECGIIREEDIGKSLQQETKQDFGSHREELQSQGRKSRNVKIFKKQRNQFGMLY